MDQMAGSLTASLDQPVGSILDEPAGPGIGDAIGADPAGLGADSAIGAGPAWLGIDDASIGSASETGLGIDDASNGSASETGLSAALAYVPSAPPAPAWLIRRPARRSSRRTTVLALAGLTLAAVALSFTTVNLAIKGFAAERAGAPAAIAAPLVQPAPDTAGGLPLHSPMVSNPGTRRVMAQFHRRFAALLDGSAAVYPGALYNEPGRVDLVTGGPAWVLYAGFNERPALADPAATLSRLMASLAGPGATVRPWTVAAGPAGGIAKCVVAIVGLTQVSVCGWATDATIGAVLSPTRDTSVTELAVLMSRMRPDLQPG